MKPQFKRLYRKDGMIADIIQSSSGNYMSTYLPGSSYKKVSKFEMLAYEDLITVSKASGFIEINETFEKLV